MNPSCMADVDDEKLEKGALCIKTLGHPLRLKILVVLGGGEATQGEILSAIGTSQSNVAQHLARLRDKGVLATRKEANQVFYRVRDPKLFALLELVRELFCEPSS